jgi:hypothetical protein
MKHEFEELILKVAGADSILGLDEVQSLWSGYGQILRVHLEGGSQPSVIAKHVHPPSAGNHPRGWNTDLGHERKLRSYQVETHWYDHWAERCGTGCRVPQAMAIERRGNEIFMVLEDLYAAGYPLRKSSLDWKGIESCLSWLAHFHATFLSTDPEGLWPVGTYWHLATRPDELEALDDLALRKAASEIDRTLSACDYKTFVHGDAKLANFCFAKNSSDVAAVDFQYVGGGCGMKDVAYFVGSCMSEHECETQEAKVLASYFDFLRHALIELDRRVDFEALKTEWTELYPFAWTDFHRFLKGWSPGHWKIHSYSERQARDIIRKLS